MLDEIRHRIEEEIEKLIHELKVVLPRAIEKAVEHGDLKENADYKSALERQQFVQARLNHLTQRMTELSAIDVDGIARDRVGFGSRLKVVELASGEELSYTIVSGDFIDLEAGHISMASPLGRAFLGARLGDEVDVSLPAGSRSYRILELVTLPEMLSD
jgi:transcription elongation factor GreA